MHIFTFFFFLNRSLKKLPFFKIENDVFFMNISLSAKYVKG